MLTPDQLCAALNGLGLDTPEKAAAFLQQANLLIQREITNAALAQAKENADAARRKLADDVAAAEAVALAAQQRVADEIAAQAAAAAANATPAQ